MIKDDNDDVYKTVEDVIDLAIITEGYGISTSWS